MTITRSRLRAALAAAAGAVALTAMACAALAAAPQAHAATAPYTLTLSATSGSYTDADTLTATLPGCADSDYYQYFLYAGTDSWNTAAIDEANGIGATDPNQPYLAFDDYAHPPLQTAAWPGGLTSGYVSSAYGFAQVFDSTADVVANANQLPGFGTGSYTLAVACYGTDGRAVLDGSGAPIAASLPVELGASSWSVPGTTQVGTDITLTGTSAPGTTSTSPGTLTLTATVTAADGTIPAGSVSFYWLEGGSVDNPLGSVPVPLDSTGTARWTGPQERLSDAQDAWSGGNMTFIAKFVPAAGSPDASSHVYQTVPVAFEQVALSYSVAQDTLHPGTANVTANATATGTFAPGFGSLDLLGIGVFVDGGFLPAATAQFDPTTGQATVAVPGLSAGDHTITVRLTQDYSGFPLPVDNNNGLNRDGLAVTTTPADGVTAHFGPYISAVAVTLAASPHGAPTVTALVTGQTSAGAPTKAVPAGTVDFKDGTTDLGTQLLTYSGGSSESASVPVYSLPAGANDLTATFTPTNPAVFAATSGSLQVTVPSGQAWVQPGLPVITGTTATGHTLTVSPGTWGPGNVTLSYQWYADGSAIRGATGSTLALGKAELGKYIQVNVTGSEPGYTPSDVFTPAVGPVTKR